MDFVRKFQAHHVERIRRAILAYRDRHNVGDVLLTKELLQYFSENVTQESVQKNLYRLRTGENIRGTGFLNACVQFLEVEMATPPDEELGLAMRQFVGNVSAYAGLWNELAGDYGLRVEGETAPDFSGSVIPQSKQGAGLFLRQSPERPPSIFMFVALSISQGESMDYGVARERYYLPNDDAAPDDEDGNPAENWIDRKGICLPIGGQDLLILIRDFMLSHMYVLKREASGFSGTLILPSPFERLTGLTPAVPWQSQYAVVLQQVPQKAQPSPR